MLRSSLNSSLSIIFFCATILSAAVGQAQEQYVESETGKVYTLYRLPRPALRMLCDGDGTLRCDTRAVYTFKEFRELLHIDADLRRFALENANLRAANSQLERSTETLLDATLDYDELLENRNREVKRLDDKWRAENKKRHIAENKSIFGDWLPWGVAGAFGVSTLVLSLVMIAGG